MKRSKKDEQILAFIKKGRKEGLTWRKLSVLVKNKFKVYVGSSALSQRLTYDRKKNKSRNEQCKKPSAKPFDVKSIPNIVTITHVAKFIDDKVNQRTKEKMIRLKNIMIEKLDALLDEK
jgi:hypothetical protein